MSVLKLLLVLALIILGIKRKVFVGYLLLGAGIVTAALFGYGAGDIARGIWKTFSSLDSWRLYAALATVTILGHLLRETGALDELTGAAQQLSGGKRTAVAILPAAVGLMPMPGGALLSAPLVGEVLANENKSAPFLSAANYWFRHVMEFFWPLYPWMILAAGITGMPIQQFSFLGVIMSAVMILLGYLFFLRRVSSSDQASHSVRAMGRILSAIWPLLLAVVLALVFEIDIVLALVAAMIAAVLIGRTPVKTVRRVISSAVTIRLFALVFGILVFKDLLEATGAVAAIPVEISHLGIPPSVVMFTVAFLTGLLSGMLAAFVGLSFPILAGYLYIPEINVGNIFFTFLSGYLGMILSPTHFCLLLTSEHFKADLGSVYRVFAIPAALLALFGFGLYFLGYPWDFFTP